MNLDVGVINVVPFGRTMTQSFNDEYGNYFLTWYILFYFLTFFFFVDRISYRSNIYNVKQDLNVELVVDFENWAYDKKKKGASSW